MPRFYFDTHDGSVMNRDVEGHDLADYQSARSQALQTLPDMARDTLTKDGDRRDIIVDIRDEDGQVIYTASLSLLGRWLL